MSDLEGCDLLDHIHTRLTRIADNLGHLVQQHTEDEHVTVKTVDLKTFAGVLDDLARQMGIALEDVSDAPEPTPVLDLSKVITS